MEIRIKKVHTLLDLVVSVAVIAAGVGLYFVLPGWGILFCLIGVLLIVFWKRASKRVGESTLLKEIDVDLVPECRDALIGFLEGDGELPELSKSDDGDHLWMEVFFNKDEKVAYARLYDVAANNFEPATGMLELRGPKAEKLISRIL